MCHWQHINGVKAGKLAEEGACTLKTVMEWKLDMIAWFVINDMWTSSRKDISQALKIIAECYKEERTVSLSEQEQIKDKIHRLKKRKQSLLDMRADGEITKEEYAVKRKEYEVEIHKLELSLAEARASHAAPDDCDKKMSSIKTALDRILDLSRPKLDREIVDGFIWKLVHIADHGFELYLSMGNDPFGSVGAEEKVIRYKVFGYPEPEREERIRCTKLKTIVLTYEDAVRYRAMSGKRVLKNKWEDLVVHIYI